MEEIKAALEAKQFPFYEALFFLFLALCLYFFALPIKNWWSSFLTPSLKRRAMRGLKKEPQSWPHLLRFFLSETRKKPLYSLTSDEIVVLTPGEEGLHRLLKDLDWTLYAKETPSKEAVARIKNELTQFFTQGAS